MIKYVKLNELKQELKKCNFRCYMSFYDHPCYVKCYFSHFKHENELLEDCQKADKIIDKYRDELELSQYDKSGRFFNLCPAKK